MGAKVQYFYEIFSLSAHFFAEREEKEKKHENG